MPIAEVPNLMPVLPELFMVVIAMTLLMYGVFQKQTAEGADVRTAKVSNLGAVVALIIAIGLIVSNAGETVFTFENMFVSDPYANFFKVLALISSGLALYMSHGYMERQGCARFEYSVLVLLATVGMMMMISANNLISLYMGLEMQSLSLYVIASFQKDDARSTEAGLKYFVLGALASGMFLYGASMIYGFSGTTDFTAMGKLFAAEDFHVSTGLVVGIVFILAGLAFKVSAVPFHMWTPDVYEGAPTPVTAFFAAAPKIAAIALLIRVMVGPFGDLADQWRQIVIFVSVASMFVGAFAAIAQTNIKRLMAYSSIGHIGYALIGLAVGDQPGVRGIMIYMGIYIFMNLGTFACILAMKRDGRMVEKISDLAGLGKTHPVMAAALTTFMFSMAGIPPLAGFFGKFYVFMSAIDAGLYTLAIIGVLLSVVGSFYYIRIIKIMYFDEAEAPLDKNIDGELKVVLAISSAVILLFFLVPSFLLNVAESAATTLFGG